MAAKHSSEKAVLYLRRSTDRQETSIADQRSELIQHSHQQGYEIVGEYVDDAISGDKTEDRVEFLRMRDDAASGGFSVILCWDQDRFGRFDLIDAGFWITPFRQAGVRLETIAQGRIDWEDLVGQLIYSVNQLGKAQYLRDLSRNTTRGLRSSAKEGRAGTGGPSPFGYRSKDGKVWIIKEEAETVRLIFKLFLKSGGSLRSVAGELNRRKIPTPSKTRDRGRRSTAWRDSSVRAIIKREKYTGTFVYLAQSSGTYFANAGGEIIPRRRSDKITPSEPITHASHFKAIISQKTFDQAQAKLEAGRGDTAPKTAHKYLFSSLLRCGDCGGSMGGKMQRDKAIYRCRLYQHTGRSACFCNSVKEGPLASAIVKKIQDQYLCDSALDRLREAIRREQKRTAPKPKDLKRIKIAIAKLDTKINNAEDVTLEAPANLRPGLYAKLEELTNDRDRLKAELAALTSHAAQSNGKDDAEVDRAIDALRDLGTAFSKARPEDTKELLSSVISRIDLHYDHTAGETGRSASTFTHGTIYVRPAVNGSTQLINKRSFVEIVLALNECFYRSPRSNPSMLQVKAHDGRQVQLMNRPTLLTHTYRAAPPGASEHRRGSLWASLGAIP